MTQALSIVAAVLAAVLCGAAVLAAVLCGMLALVRACITFALLFNNHPNIVGGSLTLIALFTHFAVRYTRRNPRGFDVMPLPPPKNAPPNPRRDLQ